MLVWLPQQRLDVLASVNSNSEGGFNMPHGKNGKELKEGDEVIVRMKITSIQTGNEYCNCTAETVEPMYPGKDKTSINLNTKQVEKER